MISKFSDVLTGSGFGKWGKDNRLVIRYNGVEVDKENLKKTQVVEEGGVRQLPRPEFIQLCVQNSIFLFH